MKIVEIVVPGETLQQAEGQENSHALEGLLYELEVRFFEAHAALNLFEDARDEMASKSKSGLSEADRQRRHDIIAEIAKERGLLHSAEAGEAIRNEANLRFKREKWAEGKEPGEFAQRRVFIAAQAFLSAVDGFEKLMGVLVQEPNVPPSVAGLHLQLREAFSSLRSAPPVPRLAAPGEEAEAPAAVLSLARSLRGNRYGSVMADGHFAMVEVSAESLDQLQAIFQATLQAFAWEGLSRHLPLI